MQTDTIWSNFAGGGVQERYYDAAGIRTRALEAGEGPPLVLLHGTGGHAETYNRNIVPLAQHFHVYAIDMVGHGFTDRPDLDYTFDDYRDHLLAFLDAIGADRAHISGESLGGLVAGWTAIHNPERLDRIVCNTGLLVRTNERGLEQLRDLAARTHALKDDLSLDVVRRRMEWLVKEPDRMTDELIALRHRIYSQPGMLDTVGRIMDAILEMSTGSFKGVDYYEAGILRRIQCPTLVLWTSHNPGRSVEVVRGVIDDIPDARLEVLDDAGHWPQFEQADEVNRLHIEFLSGPR